MIKKILSYLDLHIGEEDRNKVIENVISGTSFRGSSLWILACAIVIASVGLNMNSTAVIIGAMLISPLMGPIVGTGFALGTYDSELLKKSIKNLLIATLVSLAVSAMYFYISPFKETQSELLARTSPNIYDVLIAFFGGLVGVIAITRVEKGNPIPGVAIATALMPPLCTAGYGLAIGNFQYFLGAFYLYCINCFFICIATFLIIKYLKYQPVKAVDEKYEKQIKYGITILIFVMIVPSSYLAYELLNEKKYVQNVEKFIAQEFINEGYAVVYQKIILNENPRKVEIAFLNKKVSPKEIEKYNKKLKQYTINNTQLVFKQDVTDLKSEILREISNNNTMITAKDITINQLQSELSQYKFEDSNIIKEISILFPTIKKPSIGRHYQGTDKDSVQTQIVFLYQTDIELSQEELLKLKSWLQEKLKSSEIIVVRQE